MIITTLATTKSLLVFCLLVVVLRNPLKAWDSGLVTSGPGAMVAVSPWRWATTVARYLAVVLAAFNSLRLVMVGWVRCRRTNGAPVGLAMLALRPGTLTATGVNPTIKIRARISNERVSVSKAAPSSPATVLARP